MKTFKNIKMPALETVSHIIVFLLSLVFGFIGIFSIFIPFIIPEDFNFFNLEDIKLLSSNTFNSPSILLYYLTILDSWLVIIWSLLTSIVFICFTNIALENFLDKEKSLTNRISHLFFALFIIACTVGLLFFVNKHTFQW